METKKFRLTFLCVQLSVLWNQNLRNTLNKDLVLKTAKKRLNTSKKQFLMKFRKKQCYTKGIRGILGCSLSKVKFHIDKLVKDGIIKHEGPTKGRKVGYP